MKPSDSDDTTEQAKSPSEPTLQEQTALKLKKILERFAKDYDEVRKMQTGGDWLFKHKAAWQVLENAQKRIELHISAHYTPNNLIEKAERKARIQELTNILFQAREHTVTDIEMIMHHTQGKVDFIEAVKTEHITDRIKELSE